MLEHETTPTERPCNLEEVQAALASMKRGKAMGDSGILAEMLKDASCGLLESVLEMFNDVLLLKAGIPSTWCRTKLVVLFKKRRPSSTSQLQTDRNTASALQAL